MVGALFYGINDELSGIIVDTTFYYSQENPTLKKTLFFGDDDYNNQLIEMTKESEKFDINLLMGHYFFLGNEKLFENNFSKVIDEEEYVHTIQNSKYLLTASLQTALESLACGNYPVLFKRFDKNYNEELIKNLNLPIIESDNLKDLITKFDKIIKNYPIITNFKITNFDNIVLEIKEKIELFKKMTQL